MAFLSPLGDGTLSITASNNLSTPSPVLPDVSIISSFLNPNVLINSLETLSTSELGKSILLITGIISKSFSKAR